MPEFKEGDLVQLKSGTGPTMTIASLDRAAGEAVCRWWKGRQSQEDIFDVVALEFVHQPRPTPTSSSVEVGNPSHGLSPQ